MNLSWKSICRLTDVPRHVTRPQELEVALFRTASDAVYALLDYSPRKDGPLSQGMVFGSNVACPLHNWTIGLAGHALTQTRPLADPAQRCT